MLSFIKTLFSYFYKTEEDEDDLNKEEFLAEQLVGLEVTSDQYDDNDNKDVNNIPRDAKCFQGTGVITYMDECHYVLIDGMIYFDLTTCLINVQVNDKVLYLAYRDANDRIVVVRILENLGVSWGEEETFEVNDFSVISHIIVGEVEQRQNRYVYVKESDLKFSLDEVESTFVPIQGDWLELNCKVQWDENKPCDISSAQVLQVDSIRPLRTKVKKGIITEWFGEAGTIDRVVYFHKDSLDKCIEPQVGSKVVVEMIESNQGICTWRAIKLIISEIAAEDKNVSYESDEEQKSLIVERDHKIEITHPIKFENIDVRSTAQIKLVIVNNSDDVQFINKWIILSKKKDSQVNVEPFLTRPKKLYPKTTFTLNITCQPKFLGNTKECFIIMFKGFQAKRFIDITIVNENTSLVKDLPNEIHNFGKSEYDKIESLRKIRLNKNQSCVPGERVYKPPNFVCTRLSQFPIPEKIWSAVLGDSNQAVYSSDFNLIIERIEESLPCLSQELNINNYIDKWHTLQYMEEVQINISMRRYDMNKVFLVNCQEYLGLEVKGLAEQRPSLIKGDKVLVKDIWNPNMPVYEGFIHVIKGDLILIKFNQRFHETYTGSDVSVEFHGSRTIYKRCHHAINLSLSNLGPNVLFPRRVSPRPSQIPTEALQNIQWFNQSLNSGQKFAVSNILSAECRPLPYCIFGPPGTGKTITVIETILQILKVFPDSRILVATPSNSAANLITERLLQYRSLFSDSIIRLIAHYLVDSDNIPEIIKPFCATMDITKEFTNKSNRVVRNGINLNCQTTFIGRHRVTIGTCLCLGTLAVMGLPKGHFTHVIVDEAGQATEPEIMIPLTFIDKDNGQIILAGDPMQLGPVVFSRYCKEFGMDESYLERILNTFPYQKDYAAFKNGYDQRLITKLTDNYRSLSEVLFMSSKLFYDATLVEKINRNQSWILNKLEVINNMFYIKNNTLGGIYFYGIRGCNTKAFDSPSWFNPQEASMIALTTCKLFKQNIAAGDIGIITPYIAQVKYLKLVFEAMGLPQPKIGSVEDFQGQERPIIIISTVRSTESYLLEDQRNCLGFVGNPKRLNVALSRAQVATVVFGDPHLLCQDALWKQVISYSVNEEKYMGCDLPSQFNCNDINTENKPE